MHKIFLFALQPKNGKVGTKQHLVIDPQRNNVSNGGGGWIKPKTGLIAGDVEIYIGSEAAQHDALFNKANRPVRQDEIYSWEQAGGSVNQKRAGNREIQDWRGRANMKQHGNMMLRTELIIGK